MSAKYFPVQGDGSQTLLGALQFSPKSIMVVGDSNMHLVSVSSFEERIRKGVMRWLSTLTNIPSLNDYLDGNNGSKSTAERELYRVAFHGEPSLQRRRAAMLAWQQITHDLTLFDLITQSLHALNPEDPDRIAIVFESLIESEINKEIEKQLERANES